MILFYRRQKRKSKSRLRKFSQDRWPVVNVKDKLKYIYLKLGMEIQQKPILNLETRASQFFLNFRIKIQSQ